jgi:adenylate kinase
MSSITIFLGAPGAGKGTQAVRFSSLRLVPHVSTGDLFRANLSEATPIGLKAKAYMDRGDLVPDDVVLDMLADRVNAPDCQDGYLLDGFPRTLPQAEALDERIGEHELRVASIEVADETLFKRASGRLLCRTCDNIQHREFSPPAVEGVCDADGGELYQRSDDAIDVVRERLGVYHEQTEPLVRFYEAKGVLRRVDGERTPDEVFAALEAALPERD